jgi:carbon monoxide dehydrogenase subunit G
MRLQFSGAPEVTASRSEVWRHLIDPDFVARSAPGVESVQRIDDTHFKVVSGFGVGSIKLRFVMDVELHDIAEPSIFKMRARGKAPGSNVDVRSAVELDELGPALTRMRWNADSEVSGSIASIGARLMESTARKLTEQFWQDFATRVGRQAV